MSAGENPFNEPPGPSEAGPGDGKPAWITAGVLGVALVAVSLLWASALGKVRSLEPLRPSLDEANASLATAQADNNKIQEQVSALQTRVADLEKEKDETSQRAKGLEDEMRADLESKDVTISQLQGKLTVNILDRVLFDSGEAVLKPDGEEVLKKIGAILTAHPELKIHVVGHTDNIPIRSRFASNWELSTARALAAVHFLTEKAGMDPRRVGAVGYGEFRPIADNSTEEGRARNRRIAITILPDELAGSDAVPTARTNAPLTTATAPGGLESVAK